MRLLILTVSLALVPFTGLAANVFTGGSCTNDSSLGSGYECSKAFDGVLDVSHRWVSSDTSFPHWVQYDLGTDKAVQNWRTAISYNFGQSVADFKIQGSTNGTDWVDIVDDVFPVGDENMDTYIDWTPYSTTTYRYYRFLAETSGQANNYATLVEWYGDEIAGTSTSTSTTSTSTLSVSDRLLFSLWILVQMIIIGIALTALVLFIKFVFFPHL